MRPIASTSVISKHSRAAPELASIPRWARCQSVMHPSTAEYWHIGETMTRFSRARPRRRIGWNSAAGIGKGGLGSGRERTNLLGFPPGHKAGAGGGARGAGHAGKAHNMLTQGRFPRLKPRPFDTA